MSGLGAALAAAVKSRIQHGYDVNDNPAPALKPPARGTRGYAQRKLSRGLQPIRDWTFTGRTLRALGVKNVEQNAVTVGFTDPMADLVAWFNNRRARQFGASPTDGRVVNAAIQILMQQSPVVQAKRIT